MRITKIDFYFGLFSCRKLESQLQIILLLNGQKILFLTLSLQDSLISDTSKSATETRNGLANNGGAS
jgi:hypothetical protein